MVEASPTLYLGLRVGGAAFKLWLAWDAWRGAEAADEAGPAALGAFGRGFISNVLNPKAALFYLAVPPQFVDASRDPKPQLLTLVAAYVVVATLVHLGVVAGSTVLRSGAGLSGPSQVRVRKAMAALLALVALWLIWESRR